MTIPCRVVGVTDGDTLTCLTEEKQQIKVRLAQIDAPEKAQPFGQRSKQALSDLVFQKDVVLEKETTDKYGRMVAKVLKDGKDVNLEMVRQGMAWVYDQYAHDREYFAIQQVAKSSRAGLWSDVDPVRPSDWRHGGGSASLQKASAAAPAVLAKASGKFSCNGKSYCREMTSCEEAQFYLNSCGVSRLDRDRDGVACETLCR
ncbi:thermonuclease family protein [Propionivibrio limicola]|uniref:thermonuclease family protein n=1 Tax=Propionivibrio limicola TaxID=167645 RepID=UPI001FE278DD|nr:thermonuclease family protein [Propionivibrio limicola]